METTIFSSSYLVFMQEENLDMHCCAEVAKWLHKLATYSYTNWLLVSDDS